ncbi:hypothetical protein AAVH_11963 [Aphelenchoides avenae]|nr:hypothetical protein AAVH_11963 [Aphelenchus avenae]
MERPRKRRYNEASTVVIEPSDWAALPSFEDSGYSGSSDEDVQVVPPRSTEADEQYKTDAIEQLKRKVAELTAELEATKTELHATKNELGQSKLQLQTANISLGLEKHRSTQLEESLKDARSSIPWLQQQAQAARDEHTPIFGVCRCQFAATSLNCDFLKTPAPTVALTRGGHTYSPPYGSYRYALQNTF